MLSLIKVENKIVGFKYYPALEISVGIFIALSCVIFVSLWLWYNRNNLFGSWFDIIAIVLGLILFGFISYNLIRNYMEVKEIRPGVYNFYQCMRAPETNLDIDTAFLKGAFLKEETSKDNNEPVYYIHLRINSNGTEGETLFYFSINKLEVEQITNTINEICQNISGEKNK